MKKISKTRVYLCRAIFLLWGGLLLTGCVQTGPTQESEKEVSRPIVTDHDCNDEYSCAMSMRERMVHHLRWNHTDIAHVVKVKFQLDQDTYLKSVKIVKSSGIAEFDQAAIQAVKASFPYKALKKLPPDVYARFSDLVVTFKPE